MAIQPFWMVLGIGTPSVRHDNPTKAKAEAERLARLNPGQEFHVLQAVGVCCKSDVIWEKVEEYDPSYIPF